MIEVNQDVLKEINKHFIIPPQPEILAQLQTITQDPEAPLSDAAELVALDVGIASAILQVINSPAYGLARTVSDIKQAVMFLGWDGVRTMVQAIKLKQAFDGNKCCISLERFWDSATDIANISMFVGQRVKSQVPVESLYALGLFHDCGIPPMAIKYDNYVKALKLVNSNIDRDIIEVEDKLYKANHATIGYYIASAWHLPKDICQLILRHHDLSLLESMDDSVEQMSFAALKLAENLVNLERRGHPTKDWVMIEGVALDVLDMTQDDYKDLATDVSDYLKDH